MRDFESMIRIMLAVILSKNFEKLAYTILVWGKIISGNLY